MSKTRFDPAGHCRAQTLGMGPGLSRLIKPRHSPPALDDGALALGGDARARADTKPRHPPLALDDGAPVPGGDARARADTEPRHLPPAFDDNDEYIGGRLATGGGGRRMDLRVTSAPT